MHAVRVLDSLNLARYGGNLTALCFLPVGRFALPPADSLHLAPYNSPVKTLVLDGDRKYDAGALDPNLYGTTFADLVDVARGDPTWVTLKIDSSYADDDSGMVLVRIAADSIVPGADLRLVGVITQDSMAANRYNASGYDRVASLFVPGYPGKAFSVARGDTLFDTLRFATAGMRLDKLGAAVFVEDENDGKILQSAGLLRFPPRED